MGFETIGGGNWKARLAAVIVAVVGGIAAVCWFGLAPAPERGGHCALCADVRLIRYTIEQYNADHPEAPYSYSTSVGPDFWDPLVRYGYFDAPPENSRQRGSSMVVTWPREGAGWVWTDSPDPNYMYTGFFNIYGIDEGGAIHDHGLNAWMY